MYDVARGNSGNSSGRSSRGTDAGQIIRDFVVDKVSEQVNKKTKQHADKIEQLVPVLDLWLREQPGARKPRFSRDDIAAAAVRIADTEGIDALSMRRLAQEIGAGTMTLYHYIRTKDELLSLVSDEVMSEVILPPNKLRGTWRECITAIAHSSRAALERHPWIFDIVDDPAVGPNGVRHFDQSLQAVSGLPGSLADKLDIIHAVDEYVFGYVMHARNDYKDAGNDDPMRDYVVELAETGDYPNISALMAEHGVDAVWATVQGHARDPGRFDRNLARLLDGIERSLKK